MTTARQQVLVLYLASSALDAKVEEVSHVERRRKAAHARDRNAHARSVELGRESGEGTPSR